MEVVPSLNPQPPRAYIPIRPGWGWWEAAAVRINPQPPADTLGPRFRNTRRVAGGSTPSGRRANPPVRAAWPLTTTPNPMKPQTLGALQRNPSVNDHEHPRVEIDLQRLVLVVLGPYPYEVDLERCNDPAQLLDYVLQVSDKPWCDRALAGELLAAIETACRRRFGNSAQGVFCPFGEPRKVNWARGRSQR